MHVPHDPHKYPHFRRTVGLSVDDDENLEELARACEIEELTALLNAAALGMKSSCAFYDRYRTHKVPSFSLYKEDSENQWKSTEEGKTNHLDMSIAFPVRVEIPLATKGRRRGAGAKMDEGREQVTTKQIIVKSWPAHVVETFGRRGGWNWLLRLLKARGAVFDNECDQFTSREMAVNLMPPRFMEAVCGALAATTDVLNDSNAERLVHTFLYSAKMVTEALHALKIESTKDTANKKYKKDSAAAENNNNNELSLIHI